MKKIHRLAPCPSYDVERMESWLTDMASEGWHLVKDSEFLGFFTFEEGTPKTVRYRLEPRPEDSSDTLVPDEEAMALAEEFGWEFADSYRQFYIYRSIRSDARELNTDCAVQAMALKSVRSHFFSQLGGQLVIAGHALLRLLKEPFRYLAVFGPLYFIGFVAFMLLFFLIDVRSLRHIIKLQKRLKENEPLNHRKPWKSAVLPHRIGQFSAILVIILLFGLIFGSCTQEFTRENPPLAVYPGDPPIVTISDLDPEGSYESKPFLDSYDEYTEHSNILATVLEWNEYGELQTADGSEISGFIRITYYETAFPWLAEGLFRDYLRNAERDKNHVTCALPDLNVDQAAGFIRVVPTVLIQHGNIFVEASMSLDDANGESALTLWAQRMAEKLTAEGGS